MVEGQGLRVNETLPFLLNKNLKMYNFEVLNAGVQGASPIYYALNTARYIDLNPDIIVLLLYENKFWEDRVR